jgi:hypothetical protein
VITYSHPHELLKLIPLDIVADPLHLLLAPPPQCDRNRLS